MRVIGARPYLYVDGNVVLSGFSGYTLGVDLNEDIFYNQCFAQSKLHGAGACVVQPGSGWDFIDFTARNLIPLLFLAMLLMIVAAIPAILNPIFYVENARFHQRRGFLL